MTVRALVWGENVHEQMDPNVRALYPDGMHAAIAGGLNADAAIKAETVTLQDDEHGLTEKRLAATDVLLWWGHRAHGDVKDEIVERVAQRVWEGMGLIVLHSGHFSKIFKRLMGTPCSLKWREAGERERVWVINRNHPIAAGLGEYVELPNTEMYGEPFTVPEPMETVFISWYEGGEVFRSGMTFQRGAGRIFYFSPGHETYPDLPQQGCAPGSAQCGKVGAQPVARLEGRRKSPQRADRQSARKTRRKRLQAAQARRRRFSLMAGKKLLLLGTGGIAVHHADQFAQTPKCRIVACVDAVPGRAAEFARRHHIGKAFDSLEAAIQWGGFDAAINATPDGVHKLTTLALIAAGKHVYCEKPLAPNYADALAMTEAAEKAGLVNMVNLTYRNSPAIQEARAMVEAGQIGELRHVEAGYRQSWLVSKAWGDWRTEDKWLWRLSKKHGSTGVLGDVGVHILDFATYGAADDIVSVKADLMTFPKSKDDRIGQYDLDANDSVTMLARMSVRRARHDRGDALRHRPHERLDAGFAWHQGLPQD